MKIHIKGARVIDPASGFDGVADLFIAAGHIVGLGAAPEGFHANRVIEATGLVACPGLVDLSARLREPGFEYKATLESELQAAAAGGVTSLACPPDTDPPLDEPGLIEMLRYRARSLNLARVHPLGALTQKLAGERLAEMAVLREAGCVAFSQAEAPLTDTQVLLRAMEYAATFDLPIWLRPQDPHLARDGVAHDGAVASRLGLRAIPACAETVALSTILLLVRATGARVHLCRLSTRQGVEMVRGARHDGLPVTCDVSIHHLHLCDEDIGWFDTHCRLTPPLRGREDRAALAAGLKEGTIDALCSDHTPVDDDAKQLPFGEAEPGATGLELLLPLTLRWAQEAGLPLVEALARVTSIPARILGIPHGRLAVGAAADICLFDPEGTTRVTPQSLRSQGKNTPFLGQTLPGRVRMTLMDGHVVFEQGGP
jgi:dihydroorotase